MNVPLRTIAFLCAIALSVPVSIAQKAPFRVLYGNDTTHILNCPSPFRPTKTPLREAYLRASIQEAKGDGVVTLLQPGMGWVPWWKSDYLPMEKHIAYLEKIGKKPGDFEKFVRDGNDLIAILIDECRKIGRPAFVSLRMNDIHHISGTLKYPTKEEREQNMATFAFFAENKDRLIGPNSDSKYIATEYAFDWAFPQVREHKFKIVEEVCKNYDLDGLELDFMRRWYLFNNDRTDTKTRARIVTAFVVRVRAALDQYAPPGKRRWLCVRIPGYLDSCERFGFDLKGLASAGVDMFNLSGDYNTDFQMQVPEVKKIVGKDKAVYGELHFVGPEGKKAEGEKVIRRRTTPVQFYTFANLLYNRGVDGVSFFNFQYYRCTYNPDDVPGVSKEPPFEVLDHIGDPDWVARQPQQYVLGWLRPEPIHKGRPFRKVFKPDISETATLDMAPPKGGWPSDAKVRIQARKSLGDSEFELVFNGRKLKSSTDVSDPFDNPYPDETGAREDFRAWILPRSVMKNGENTLTLTQKKGGENEIFYLDVSIPGNAKK